MKKNTTHSLIPVQIRYIFRLIGAKRIADIFATVLAVFLLAFIFSLISPAAGEAWLYNVVIVSGVLTASFLALVAMMIMGAGSLFVSLCASFAYRLYRKEVEAANSEARQLSGGGHYYVGSDIIVTQNEGESDNVFKARVSDFIDAQTEGQWVVALAFRDSYVRIKDGTAKGKCVPRGRQENEKEEEGILPEYEQGSFSSETRSEYNEYISKFLPRFKTYAEWYRVEKLKLPPFMKPGAILNTVLFLLFTTAAAAQNNVQKIVNATAQNNIVPVAGQEVNYVFSDGSSALRVGDGQKKLSELFASRVGADAARHGELAGISVNGKAINIRAKIPATGTADNPQPLFQTRMDAPHNETVPQKSFSESLPDSAHVADSVNKIIQDGDSFKTKLWKSVAPVWNLFMWVFGSLFWLLMGAGGLFWYMATTARQNGNLGYTVLRAQRWASRNVLFICWTFTIVILVNIFLQFIYMDWPLWSVVVCWFITLYVANRVTNWVTPNGVNVHFDEGIARYEQKALNQGNRNR